MNIPRKLVGIGMLLMLLLPVVAQEKATIISLAVRHDGKEERPPDYVTLSFDRHSATIPVREGRFKIPPEFVSAQKVTFAADIESDRILIPDLPATRFAARDWTLLLAERRYDEGYQWAVPKGAAIRRSCILVFESTDTDPGTFSFYPGCRTKHK